jgi:hypothetical protein
VADRSWPKAEVRDGKLLVEGERYPFVRGLQRQIWLVVGKLILERHIEIEESRTRRTDRLSAIATVEHDRLAIAGVKGTEDAAQDIAVSIKPAPDEEKKFHWNVSFGLLPHDSKATGEDVWYCEVYMPARVFNELVAAYKSGVVESLRLSCACDMWVREGIQRLPNLPAGAKVTWYLSPPLEAASKAPGIGRGMVKDFSWFEVTEPKPGQSEAPELAASQPRGSIRQVSWAALIATLLALAAAAAFFLAR